MKCSGCILLLLLTASTAWSAKKMSIGELRGMLQSLQQQNKSDAEVADVLKQVQLTEELSRNMMTVLRLWWLGIYPQSRLMYLKRAVPCLRRRPRTFPLPPP